MDSTGHWSRTVIVSRAYRRSGRPDDSPRPTPGPRCDRRRGAAQFSLRSCRRSLSRCRRTARSAISRSRCPFQLARTLKKAPRAIAQELAAALGQLPGVARVDVAPNGYLNLFLDRSAFLLARVRGEVAAVRADEPKTIVEHTAINPNKAAHIGHLRNAALGDTLVARAPVPRHAGRNPELHRRHRRPGGRRHRRIPGARTAIARRRAAHRRHDPVRLLLLGPVFARHRMVRAATRAGSPSAPPRSTISSTAPARPPRWARSSSIGSSARTWRRWRG